MLRSSVIVLAVLAAASPVRASWAEAMFEELSKDFGSVPRGTVAVHPFRLVNNTGKPVQISSVRVSCGCTTARALQTFLAPGQETAIVAQMNTRVFYNTRNVTIYVQFSQPRFEEVRLWVQANSRDDVAFTPDTLNFGKIKRGTTPTSEVTVSFLGNGQTQIIEAKCDSNYITPSFQEVRRDVSEVSYKVTAQMRPDTPAGKWYSDVWVKTNNPAMPKLRIPLTVEVESALSVSPNVVTLGQVKAGTESDRKVILRGVRPFRIMNITGTDKHIRVKETTSESKTVHVLTVTLHLNEPGMFNRVIRVHTDLKTGGDIEFTAQAEVVP